MTFYMQPVVCFSGSRVLHCWPLGPGLFVVWASVCLLEAVRWALGILFSTSPREELLFHIRKDRIEGLRV